MSPLDPATGIPMDVAMLMRTELGQPLLCTGSYYGRERIFDLLVVTDVDSYRLDVFAATLARAGGPTIGPPEEECCWRVTLDFVEAAYGGRDTACSGRLGAPGIRALASRPARPGIVARSGRRFPAGPIV